MSAIKRLLLTIVAIALLMKLAAAQPKEEQPPPLRYTVRSELGSRSSQDRTSVLKTREMTAEQIRAWAEDKKPEALNEDRSATLFRSGYLETISRGSSGLLEYSVRNPLGLRMSHNRESVLKTVSMNADDIKAWADSKQNKAEGRTVVLEGKRSAQITVGNSKVSITSQDAASASSALNLPDEQLWDWVKDEKAAKEGRAAMRFGSGHVEWIWRGNSGQVLYGVRSERRSATSRNRESVLKTLAMTDEEVKEWAKDEAAAKERRTAAFYLSGYVAIISRGQPEEPPNQ
jgi:hypothetical protein